MTFQIKHPNISTTDEGHNEKKNKANNQPPAAMVAKGGQTSAHRENKQMFHRFHTYAAFRNMQLAE